MIRVEIACTPAAGVFAGAAAGALAVYGISGFGCPFGWCCRPSSKHRRQPNRSAFATDAFAPFAVLPTSYCSVAVDARTPKMKQIDKFVCKLNKWKIIE